MTNRSGRVEIPPDVAGEVLFLADRTCCVCRQRSRPVQLHHIDGDPTNSVVENLAVLCFDCHRETQIQGGFDRKLDAAQVRLYKADWTKRVERQRGTAEARYMPATVGRKRALKYCQIREESEELLFDFEADYVLVESSDEASDAATNLYINALVASSFQDFRESSLNTAKARQGEKEGAKSKASYWNSLVISHKVSLYSAGILSLEFQIWTYGAGAAHGNSFTKVLNLQLHPAKEFRLRDIFRPSTDHLKMLSSYCLDDLRKQRSLRQSDSGAQTARFESDYDRWVVEGTAATEENYRCYSIASNGMKIHFDPYRVGPYAEGKYEVFIPAYVLRDVVEANVATLLDWT